MDPEILRSSATLGVSAFLIALTGAMAPGPLLTVTITETIKRGRFSAVLLLVGHALLEALLLIGFAFGLQEFLGRETVATVLAVVGGVFLVWMGGSLLWDAVNGHLSLDLQADEKPRRTGPVVTGALVSISNPYWTLWWVTVGVKLASDGLALGPLGVGAFFIGHELADFAWYVVIIMAVHSGRRFLSDQLYRGVIGVCAAFLVFLGISFVASVF